jgi:hypothetical protein
MSELAKSWTGPSPIWGPHTPEVWKKSAHGKGTRCLAACRPMLDVPVKLEPAQYGLVKSYQGQSFFNDWIFYNKVDDLTQGNVMCVPTPRPPVFTRLEADADVRAQVCVLADSVECQARVRRRLGAGDHARRQHDQQPQVRRPSQLDPHHDQGPLHRRLRLGRGHDPYPVRVRLPVHSPRRPPLTASAPQVLRLARVLVVGAGVAARGQDRHVRGREQRDDGADGPAHRAGLHAGGREPDERDRRRYQLRLEREQQPGCVTRNPDPIGYGAPLAAGGGGVWVTEFASSGIS